MEIRELNTFLTLSKENHFTKTAQQLGYAQSNVTAQIQKLEEELGVKLFERIGKSVHLTEEGERLVPYASRMLGLKKEIEALYTAKNPDGRIVIGASESLSIYVLPPILKAYKEQHPNVELYLRILDIDDFIPLLNDNSIDLAFALDLPVKDDQITVATNRYEPVSLFCSATHPLASRQQLSVEDLEGLPLIVTGKDCVYRKEFEKLLAAHHVRCDYILETGSVPVIKESTLSGLGICLLPDTTVSQEIERGSLVRLPLKTSFSIYSQLMHHKDKWISPNLEAFMECFRGL